MDGIVQQTACIQGSRVKVDWQAGSTHEKMGFTAQIVPTQ